uniref:Immunoglobulin V-set domain-containing protein n=1 Tax=Xiphophorus couchianus TaxID=32473 RepID=A0A3B5MF51_9TELE
AQIHCIIHSRTAEDLQVALLRGLHGNQKICTSTLNTSEHEKEMQQEKDGDVRLLIKDGAVVVTLSGLKATHTDIYRCAIQVFYPPPYQQLTGNGTLLHVLGRSPQSQLHLLTERLPFISVTVVVLVIAVICVLIIIITFQVGA